MNIVVASLPAYGHLFPLMPLALACAEAGHEVTVATGAPFVGQLPLPTIQSVPPDADIDALVAEARRRHPEATDFDLVLAMFADVSADAVSEILLAALENNRPDLVVYEAMNTGAGVAATVLGIPAVAFAISIMNMGYAGIHPATVNFQQHAWTDRGLTPPRDAPLLGEALLDRHRRCFGRSISRTRCPGSRSEPWRGPEAPASCRTGYWRPGLGPGSI